MASDREDLAEPAEKPKPCQCVVFHHFLPAADLHETCVVHRQCSSDKPCKLDHDWSEEQWKELWEKAEEQVKTQQEQLERQLSQKTPAASPASSVSTADPSLTTLLQSAIREALASVTQCQDSLEAAGKPAPTEDIGSGKSGWSSSGSSADISRGLSPERSLSPKRCHLSGESCDSSPEKDTSPTRCESFVREVTCEDSRDRRESVTRHSDHT